MRGSLFKLLEPAEEKPIVLFDHSQLEREIDANDFKSSIDFQKTFKYVDPDKFGPKSEIPCYTREACKTV